MKGFPEKQPWCFLQGGNSLMVYTVEFLISEVILSWLASVNYSHKGYKLGRLKLD